MIGNFGCPYMANGAFAYPPPPPANGMYSAGAPPPGYAYPGPPPAGRALVLMLLFLNYYCEHRKCKTYCFYLDPTGGFYPPGFDGPAAYMPPPPYSAPVNQAPLDPDLPRTPAGTAPGPDEWH